MDIDARNGLVGGRVPSAEAIQGYIRLIEQKIEQYERAKEALQWLRRMNKSGGGAVR